MTSESTAQKQSNFLEYDELTSTLRKIEAICAKNNLFSSNKTIQDAQEKILLLQQRITRLQKISKLI